MKNRISFVALRSLVLLLILLSACQMLDAQLPILQGNNQPVSAAEREAIVAEVVATLAAQGPAQSTLVGTAVPAVESSLPVVAIDGDLEDRLVSLYNNLNLAVVNIFVFDRFQNPEGSGSGFVYDDQGYIVTNNHVVAGSRELEVVFSTGDRIPATVVGSDVDSDLAVIKVESLPDGIPTIPLGDSNEIEVGQFVVAIGNPFGEAGSMSVGIVSGLGRTLSSQRIAEGGGRYSLPRVIQTDAAINPGNSGGPLLNLNGEVVGVNSAIRTDTGTNSGVGFSIPVNAVRRIVPALVAEGQYVYPYIGIRMSSLNLAIRDDLELPQSAGAYVTEVNELTPASDAGLIGSGVSDVGELLPGGDLIIAIDGQTVNDPDELISHLVFETTAGQIVDLTVLRNGEQVTVPLTLGERP